jgi:hypothetical protein
LYRFGKWMLLVVCNIVLNNGTLLRRMQQIAFCNIIRAPFIRYAHLPGALPLATHI